MLSRTKEQVKEVWRNGNGVWKWVATHLAAILVTGTIAWFAFGQQSITKAEAVELIEKTSPYVYDKRALEENLSRVTDVLEELKEIANSNKDSLINHENRLSRIEDGR